MFENINVFYFIVSFCVGIGYIYMVTPSPTIVNKFPSPYNTKNLVYRDNDNNCYKYTHEKVKCNGDNVIHQPVLENFNSS